MGRFFSGKQVLAHSGTLARKGLVSHEHKSTVHLAKVLSSLLFDVLFQLSELPQGQEACRSGEGALCHLFWSSGLLDLQASLKNSYRGV